MYINNFQTNRRKQLNKENLISPEGSSEEENLKKQRTGTSLLVQRLRQPSITGDTGLLPAQEAKIPHASWSKKQNIKQKQQCNKFNKDQKWSTLKKKNKTENRNFLLVHVNGSQTSFLNNSEDWGFTLIGVFREAGPGCEDGVGRVRICVLSLRLPRLPAAGHSSASRATKTLRPN